MTRKHDFGTLNGVIPVLVTPFEDSGEVDLSQLSSQVEFLIDRGVTGVALGFGSEVPRLSTEDAEALMRHVVSVTGGRIYVMGNAEMTSVRGGSAAIRRMEQAGADLVLLRPNNLEWAEQDALFETILETAVCGGLPVVVQDAPQHTGVRITAETLARLLGEKEIVAVKVEAPGSAAKISTVRSRLGAAAGSVLAGAGGVDWLHELQRGADGTMPGPAYPEVFQAVHLLSMQGHRSEAAKRFARALPLLVLGTRDLDTFLFVQKYVLLRRGVMQSTRLGRPHRPIDPRLIHEIDELLEVLELLKFFDDCHIIASA